MLRGVLRVFGVHFLVCLMDGYPSFSLRNVGSADGAVDALFGRLQLPRVQRKYMPFWLQTRTHASPVLSRFQFLLTMPTSVHWCTQLCGVVPLFIGRNAASWAWLGGTKRASRVRR